MLTALLAFAAVAIWRPHRPFDPSVDRIAVLPMSSDDDADGWLAEALTDHLARTMARIEGLTVVAPGSSERFSDRSDPGEIGRRMGVGAVRPTPSPTAQAWALPSGTECPHDIPKFSGDRKRRTINQD